MDEKELQLKFTHLAIELDIGPVINSDSLRDWMLQTTDVCSEYLKNHILPAFKDMDLEIFNVNLSLIESAEMQRVNNLQRGINRDTDVLSFPTYENIRSGCEEELLILDKSIELGDLLISLDKAKEQADEFQVSLEQEISHLFVHGLLHLLGYDHELSVDEEKLMESLEKKLMIQIYKKKGLEY